MATVYCDNCGTSLLEETSKFCRACGKPTPLSEAATKRFDEPTVVKHPTSPVGSYTTPAYMAPFDMPPAEQTNDLRQKRQKRNLIIVASMMAMMIVALAGLMLWFTVRAGPQGIPVPPPPPPPIGAPPMPPPPPGINTATGIDPSLIYPGSTQTMTVQGEDGTRVLKLHSDDSSTKVADWYKARLRVTKTTEILGQTIMRAGDINVIIFGGDEGAEILITRGDGDK
jgi:hypothetical protein